MEMIKILVPNQYVKVKWANKTKGHYISKGYNYTKNNDTFMVKAEDLMKYSKTIVDVQCDFCGDIVKKSYDNYTLQVLRNGTSNIACKKCSINNISSNAKNKQENSHIQYYNKFLNGCNKHNLEPITQSFIGYNKNYEFKCNIHGIIKSRLEYIDKSGCKECCKNSKIKIFRLEKIKEFEKLCEIKGYTSLASVDDYVDGDTPLPYICSYHGKKQISIHNLKNGEGCRNCGREIFKEQIKLSNQEVKDIIESKNNNKWINNKSYINAINPNLIVQCGKCKNIFKVSVNNYKKNITGKCPKCQNISIGEVKIQNYLNNQNIKYISQKRFKDCKDKRTLPFDFYLPDYNCCIEFDGQQHYEPYFGIENLNKTQYHDEIKNKYCKTNNIKLIRIPYFYGNNIEEILNRELLKLNIKTYPKIIPKSKII